MFTGVNETDRLSDIAGVVALLPAINLSPVTTTPSINLLPVTTTPVIRVCGVSMDASFHGGSNETLTSAAGDIAVLV